MALLHKQGTQTYSDSVAEFASAYYVLRKNSGLDAFRARSLATAPDSPASNFNIVIPELLIKRGNRDLEDARCLALIAAGDS